MLFPPSSEAQDLANEALDRLRGLTRAQLVGDVGQQETVVQANSGAAYRLDVLSFLDSDDPEADLFVQVRVRPARSRLRRAAKAGFVADYESRVWDRGETIGELPSNPK